MGILSICALIIYIILSVLELCLFVRAICSWIPYFRASRIYQFTVYVTEPIISPLRNVLLRIDWFRRVPIDFSFLIVYILVSISMTVASALI